MKSAPIACLGSSSNSAEISTNLEGDTTTTKKRSWASVVGNSPELDLNSLSNNNGGWVKVGSRRKSTPQNRRVYINHKTFDLERHTVGKTSTLIIHERRKNFNTFCEIDLVGIAWLAHLLKKEASSIFKHKISWKTQTKLGLIQATRDRNVQGEFVCVSWSRGRRSFKPLFLPEGVARTGWNFLGNALLALIPDFRHNGSLISIGATRSDLHGKKTLVLPHQILPNKVDESSFGKWNSAIIVEVNTLTTSWQTISRMISRRFGLAKDFQILPFGISRAILFAGTADFGDLLCKRGMWEEEGTLISLKKWYPDVNKLLDVSEPVWYFLEGIPFHLWQEEDLRIILNGKGTIVKFSDHSILLNDLSGVKVFISGWIMSDFTLFEASLKGSNFLVKATPCDQPEDMIDSPLSRVSVEGLTSEKTIGTELSVTQAADTAEGIVGRHKLDEVRGEERVTWPSHITSEPRHEVAKVDNQVLLAIVPDVKGGNTFQTLTDRLDEIQIQIKAVTIDTGGLMEKITQQGTVGKSGHSSQGRYVKIRKKKKKNPPLLGPCKCHLLGRTLKPISSSASSICQDPPLSNPSHIGFKYHK